MHVLVERDGPFVWVWMNRPERRNALSLDHLAELRDAFAEVGESDARGVVLGGKGPVFSAGHDFADLAGADLDAARTLLETCTDLLDTMQAIPQPIVARVHGLATAAGCQLVATADLAVAAESAGFAAPGGKGGWFCHTPMVAIGRNVGPQAGARARAHRRHHRRRDGRRLGPREPGRAGRRARQGDPRPARARHPRQRDVEGPRQAGVLSPDRPRPARRVLRTRSKSWRTRARSPTRKRGCRRFWRSGRRAFDD